MNFFVSAVPTGAKAAVRESLRSAETAEEALAALREVAAAYPAPGHSVRVITTRRCCEEERLALRMLAHANRLDLDLV